MAAAGVLVNVARHERPGRAGGAGHSARPGRPPRTPVGVEGAVSGRRFAVIAGGGNGRPRLPGAGRGEGAHGPGRRPPSEIELVGSAAGPMSAAPGGGPGLPAHAAPRPGHRSPAAAGRPAGPTPRRWPASPGRRSRAVAPPAPPAAAGGRLGRRVRQRAGRPGRVPSCGVPLVLVNIDATAGRGPAAARALRPAPARWPSPAPRCRTPVVTGDPGARRRPARLAALARARRRPPGRPSVVPRAGAARRGGRRVARRRRPERGARWRWWPSSPGRAATDPLPRERAAQLRRAVGGPGRGGRRATRSPTGWSPSRRTWGPSTRAADVVVCRAGALSVAELALAGVPAVLVPLPGAPDDHQSAQRQPRWPTPGRRCVLADAECTGERLAGILDRLLADPDRLRRDGPGRRRASAGPTPPPAWPSWWRPMPPDARHGVAVSSGPRRSPRGRRRRGGDERDRRRCWPRMGHNVSGSDLQASAVTERLPGQGVTVSLGHAAGHRRRAPTSSPPRRPSRPTTSRWSRPCRLGMPVLARAEMLAAIADTRRARRRGRDPRQDHDRRRCSPSCWSRPACARRS